MILRPIYAWSCRFGSSIDRSCDTDHGTCIVEARVNALQTLAQAAGVAYAAGLNLYATVGIIGLAARLGWIGPLPGSLAGITSWWVIIAALTLAAIEFLASLVPAVASAWDTMHSLIRPPAAAALAAATAWHGDPAFVLIAALLGGGLAVTTHTTKLGLALRNRCLSRADQQWCDECRRAWSDRRHRHWPSGIIRISRLLLRWPSWLR